MRAQSSPKFSPVPVFCHSGLFSTNCDAPLRGGVDIGPDWNWGSTIHQSSLGQDPVAPNTSPSAVSTSGTPQVFFADEATNNSMSLWEWTPTLLQQIRLFGHPLVAGTSPGS